MRRLLFLGASLIANLALAAPPKLDAIFPAGGSRGSAVTVTLAGGGLDGKLDAWFDRPGLEVSQPPDSKEKLTVNIAADAAPGLYWLRVANAEGVSARRPFYVSPLAEVLEVEPNDAPEKPQVVEPQTIVNGKLQKSGDVDGFRVRLKAGETLIAHCDGHAALGSPMDAALQLCRLTERQASVVDPPQVEAFVLQQNHDTVGLDPRIVFTAVQDGDYLVRLFAFPSEPDSTINYTGRENFIYRLTLTTGPFVDFAFPPAVGRAGAEVELVGWNLPAELRRVQVPAATDALSFSPTLEAAGRATVFYRESPVAIAEASQDVMPPAEFAGRLLQPNAEHAFNFTTKKGAKVKAAIESRSLGFPLDSLLQMRDDMGKTLLESDDAGKDRDSELTFAVPADGNYRLAVRDLYGRGGERLAYHLRIAAPEPDFRLTLADDTFATGAERTAEITVTVDRRDGFAGEIEISAAELPAGVVAEPVLSAAKGDTAKTVKLKLKADAAENGRFVFRIAGVAKGEPALTRTATFTTATPVTEAAGCLLFIRQ